VNKLTIELSVDNNNRDKMFGIPRDRFYEHFLVEHYKSDTREEFAKNLENKIKQELNPCGEVFSSRDIEVGVKRWFVNPKQWKDYRIVEWERGYYMMSLSEIFNDSDDYHKFLAKLRKRGIHLSVLHREEKYDKLKHMHMEMEAV